MDTEALKGTWVVVANGLGRVIGKIAGPVYDNDEKKIEEPGPEDYLEQEWLKLCPCYDFDIGLQQKEMGDQVQIGKASFVTGIDSTTGPAPVYTQLTGARVMFINEMTEEDRNVYGTYIMQAEQAAARSRQSRAAGPGGPRIQMAGAMPPGMPGMPGGPVRG